MKSELIDLVEAYVRLLMEKRMREADVTGGSKVAFGSEAHIKDLEKRIGDLTPWRDRQRKGTESRANYARVLTRLKSELKSAKRALEKQKKSED